MRKYILILSLIMLILFSGCSNNIEEPLITPTTKCYVNDIRVDCPRDDNLTKAQEVAIKTLIGHYNNSK